MGMVAVLGAGRMGSVISYAMDLLEHELIIVDKIGGVPKSIEALGLGDKYKSCANLKADIKTIAAHSDIVISALPYHQNEHIAKSCIDLGIPYCDLGGRLDVSQNINDYANKNDFPWVFTDLGLAPGLVNILAEWGYHELGGADSIEMMVGGLPEDQFNNPLNYVVTWSIEGLINEYRDKCEILKDGKIEIVNGMDGVETVWVDSLGEHYPLEAFYTSGGSAHTIKNMYDRGVQNCSYKTLRYLGHADIVKFLIKDCKLSEECLYEIFDKGCKNGRKDIVIVRAVVKKDSLSWKKEFTIKSDERFSAMQKGTAFSLAAVADTMICDALSNPTRSIPKPHLTYKDVDFLQFNNNMNRMGVDI